MEIALPNSKLNGKTTLSPCHLHSCHWLAEVRLGAWFPLLPAPSNESRRPLPKRPRRVKNGGARERLQARELDAQQLVRPMGRLHFNSGIKCNRPLAQRRRRPTVSGPRPVTCSVKCLSSETGAQTLPKDLFGRPLRVSNAFSRSPL